MHRTGLLRVCRVGALLCLLPGLSLALPATAAAAETPKPRPEVLWEEYPLHPSSSSESRQRTGGAPAGLERAAPDAAVQEPRSSTVGLVLFLLALGLLAAVGLVLLTRLLLRAISTAPATRLRMPELRRQPSAGDGA